MASHTLAEALEHLRARPKHHRQNIAVATSAGITGLVVVAWFVAMSTSGAFSLKTSAVVADAGGTATEVQGAVQSTKSNFSSLMGAATAALGATSTNPSLTIVETRNTSTLDTKPQNATSQTVISF